MFKNKTIFISPLDWGLGHATRCVPLIKQLMADNVVILGITKTTSPIFDEHFPTLQKLDIEPYNIRYSSAVPLSMKLLLDAPRILRVIKKEKRQLEDIIQEHNVDVVISDNRFGMNSKHAECIYMTHQLTIQAGLLSVVADNIHHRYIKKFDAVWVPDFENERQSLAGNLSRSTDLNNVTYLGTLSRFTILVDTTEEFDYLCLLSGPEPLRTELENLLIEKANRSAKRICLVRGTQKALTIVPNKNISIINMPDASQLSHLISAAKKVVCRSGYSTLMDLHHLQKKSCILIPTPGQDEQVYLAGYWQKKFGANVMQQRDLSQLLFD